VEKGDRTPHPKKFEEEKGNMYAQIKKWDLVADFEGEKGKEENSPQPPVTREGGVQFNGKTL